jgi:hypothetical protein
MHIFNKVYILEYDLMPFLVCFMVTAPISDEEDVIFATELDRLSIGTVKIPIHIEPIFMLVHIPDLSIVEPIPKQPVELVCVLAINLTIPPDIVK